MFLNWPFSKRIRWRCSDGSVKTVYKNVDDAFPLFIPGWQGSIDAELKALEATPASAKAAYETKIQGLLYGLDELNKSLMMTFRGAYVFYIGDPCSHGRFFERQIEGILREQQRLIRLRVQISGLIELAKMQPDNQAAITNLFQNLVDSIGGPAIPDAAALEIRETRTIATVWARSGE